MAVMKISSPAPGVVAYVARNLRRADLREFRAFSAFDAEDDIAADLIRRFDNRQTIVAFMDDGTPVAAGVAASLRPNVVSLGMFATDDFPVIAAALTKWVRRDLFPRLQAGGAHRIEAVSIEGHHQAHRWLTTLGLDRVATHEAWGKNRENFHVYAWVA